MLLRRPRPRRSVEFEFVDPRVGRSRSCQNIDSSVVEKMVTSWSQTKSGRLFDLPQVIENNGELWRARTSDPLIKSVLKRSPAGYGPYDLLTFVTGFTCSLVTSLSQAHSQSRFCLAAKIAFPVARPVTLGCECSPDATNSRIEPTTCEWNRAGKYGAKPTYQNCVSYAVSQQ